MSNKPPAPLKRTAFRQIGEYAVLYCNDRAGIYFTLK